MNGGRVTQLQLVLKAGPVSGSRPSPDKVNRKVSRKCHNQRAVKSAGSRHLKSFYPIKPNVAKSKKSTPHTICMLLFDHLINLIDPQSGGCEFILKKLTWCVSRGRPSPAWGSAAWRWGSRCPGSAGTSPRRRPGSPDLQPGWPRPRGGQRFVYWELCPPSRWPRHVPETQKNVNMLPLFDVILKHLESFWKVFAKEFAIFCTIGVLRESLRKLRFCSGSSDGLSPG